MDVAANNAARTNEKQAPRMRPPEIAMIQRKRSN